MNDLHLHVIVNAAAEYLAYLSLHDGPKFHAELKFARAYRTLKGARCAATMWSNRYGQPLTAKRVELVAA